MIYKVNINSSSAQSSPDSQSFDFHEYKKREERSKIETSISTELSDHPGETQLKLIFESVDLAMVKLVQSVQHLKLMTEKEAKETYIQETTQVFSNIDCIVEDVVNSEVFYNAQG